MKKLVLVSVFVLAGLGLSGCFDWVNPRPDSIKSHAARVASDMKNLSVAKNPACLADQAEAKKLSFLLYSCFQVTKRL